MARTAFFTGIAALAASSVSPLAVAQTQGTTQAAPAPAPRTAITVVAPRPRQVELGNTGGPVETVTAQSTIYADDLDLRTAAGRQELNQRVSMAAKSACDWLNEIYPMSEPVAPGADCVTDAVNRAKTQVDAALRAGAAGPAAAGATAGSGA